MNTCIKILLIISIAFLSCNGQQSDLKKLCADIRNTPQAVFPNKGQDKKIKLIRQLKYIKAEETCDSLKAIFLSIDTSKRGFWDYKYETLYILSDLNTKRSLKVLAEITRDHPLDFPADMHFIWGLVNRTANVSVMFPDLAQSLGKQKWTDGDILRMIINANRKGHLTREQLGSSKNYLITFFDYLKIEKDSLPGSKHYESYYDAHLTDLLLCLRIFEPDERINSVYRNVLSINSTFANYCSVGYVEYNNKSKQKITALLQAVSGLLQNDQPVDEKYLELIAAEPLYHNDLYEGLLKLNKQSFFPKRYLNQEFFSLSDLAFAKENSKDFDLPDCLELFGKREIRQGYNMGIYYFYNSKYGDENKQINLAVSGPQPLVLTEFVVHGKKTNKIYIGSFEKDKVESEIDKVIKKLSD